MAQLLTRVEKALSTERLSPYLREVGGDLAVAIKMYEWNTVISAAFWADITDLEVLVRNAMHDQLTEWSVREYGESCWYLNPGGILTRRRILDIAAARTRIAHSDPPKTETPGRVVAELRFGFWRYLLASSYERTLWRTCLRKGFPGQGSRGPLHHKLTGLHNCRNRIAHHEAIYRQPLLQLHKDLLTIIEWIDPMLRQWVEQRSTVQATLAQRPRYETTRPSAA
jgi:hypothetical protein